MNNNISLSLNYSYNDIIKLLYTYYSYTHFTIIYYFIINVLVFFFSIRKYGTWYVVTHIPITVAT